MLDVQTSCSIGSLLLVIVARQLNDRIEEPAASSTLVNVHHLPSLLQFAISNKSMFALLWLFSDA